MSKSVLIIGAGWLGMPLGKVLADAGYQVMGTTTRPEQFQPIRSAGMVPLLLDLPEINIRAQDTFDWVIITIPPGRDLADTSSYAKNLFPLMEQLKAAQWIFFSTTGVYPDLLREVREDTPPAPRRNSAKAMWEGEQLLRAKLGQALHIFRLAGLAGPGREPGRFFAGKADIPGGDEPVNFVYREDVIRAVTAFMKRPLPGSLYNLCADGHPAKKEFYPVRANQAGLEVPQFLPGVGNWKIVDNGAFRRDFHFVYKYPDPVSFPIG